MLVTGCSMDTSLAENSDRRRWMGLLARADAAQFNELWSNLNLSPEFVVVKPAEQGLVMVRGRAGSSGSPFNLGEMTVTRCTIRLENGTIGHGYVSGRRVAYAQKAALVDALMQCDTYKQELEDKIISPLEVFEKNKKQEISRKVAATKVDFFTMVRGED